MPEGAPRPEPVETNMVLLSLVDPLDTAPAAAARAAAEGVRVSVFGPRQLRTVFHLDVDDAGLERALAGLSRAFAASPSLRPSGAYGSVPRP